MKLEELQKELDKFMKEEAEGRTRVSKLVNAPDGIPPVPYTIFSEYVFNKNDLDDIKEYMLSYLDRHRGTVVMYTPLTDFDEELCQIYVGHLEYKVFNKMKDLGIPWSFWYDFVNHGIKHKKVYRFSLLKSLVVLAIFAYILTEILL